MEAELKRRRWMLGGEKERQNPIARITPQEVETSVSSSPEPPSSSSAPLPLSVSRQNPLVSSSPSRVRSKSRKGGRVIIGPAKREPTRVLTHVGYARNVVTNASVAWPIQNTAERHGVPEYEGILFFFPTFTFVICHGLNCHLCRYSYTLPP